ncbi:MAG: SGNH/GDSL hydrolase family protein [Chitinophagales bacterium]
MKQTFLFLIIFFTAISCKTNSSTSKEAKETVSTPKETTAPTSASKLPFDINRFDEAIAAFKKEDQEQGIRKGEILFTGSSSIRFWLTLKEDMEGLKVLNRGFGGSTLPEMVHYADQIVFPYAPETIVLYCGENDIAAGRTPQEAFESFKELTAQITAKLPSTQLFYLCMKPSIARWEMWPQMEESNRLFADYIAEQPNMEYVDISVPMLDEKGMPRKEIFVEDMLHMNAKGYADWTKIVKPLLKSTK